MADDVTLSALSKAVSDIESGGHDDPYAAVGPPAASGDRAYGKYQVMGNNIPSWTEESGLGRMSPQQFMANPDAQEKVFRTRMGKYLDDNGGSVRDAASIWHSGVPYARAVAEGRIDHAGTRTVDYADHIDKAVSGGGVQTPSPAPDDTQTAPAVDPNTVFNDPKFWQLSDDDRLGVMKKIDPRFAALSPEDQQGVLAAKKPPTPTVESSIPPGTPVEKPAWYSGLADEAGEKFATAVSNAIESGKSLMQPPESGRQILRDVLGLLEPWTVTGEMTGEASKRAAEAGGAGPLGQKIAGVAGTVAGSLATPAPPGFGAATRLVGKGASAVTGKVGKVLGKAEEVAPAVAPEVAPLATPEAVTAARAEAPAAAAAAEKAGGTATAPTEATTAAREALAPSGATTTEIGSAAKGTLGAREARLTEGSKGIYDAYVKAHAEETVAPEVADQLAKAINETERKVGGFRGAAGDVFETIRDRLRGFLPGADAPPYTVGELNRMKTELDSMMPAVAKTAVGKDMNLLRLEVRNAVRSGATGEESAWLDTADSLWKDELKGAGMTETSIGALTKLVKKSDPTAVVEKLFGAAGEKISDKQAAIGRAVLKNLEAEEPEVAAKVKDALFNRAVDRASTGGSFNPEQLVKEYDKLAPLHSAIATPEKKAFFDVLRHQLEKNVADEAAAKAAAKAAPKEGPGMLAKASAEGIALVVGHKFAAAAGLPHYAGWILAHQFIPRDKIAMILGDPRLTRVLTRALQTPANSAVVPTLLKQLGEPPEEQRNAA